jgi:PAS domain S-box-containing protein
VDTIAVHGPEGWLPNFTYSLAGTPCADVMLGRPCHHANQVSKKFPDDRWLFEQHIESYFGVPLVDLGGAVVGLLVVLGRRAQRQPARIQAALEVFAARATAELQRKRAVDALRRSEQFHRLISEIASDYAYSCRVDADGSVHMDGISEGFTRVTGFTLAETIQRGDWISLIHPDDVWQTAEDMPQLLRGEALESELRIVTKDGQTRWIHYSCRPLWDNAQGRVTRLVGAVQDITERKTGEQQLQDYAQRLQALSRRLLEVQEQERRHLARELHDEIGQLLTGTIYALENCRRLPPAQIADGLAQVQEQVKQLTTHVRDLSLRLRPTMLDDFGLVSALIWQVDRVSQLTKIHVDFAHSGLEGRYPAELETAVYRIAQEGLTNVARHAGVSQAQLRVWRDDGLLRLQISDRGRGFDPEQAIRPGESSGLSGMKERAALLGGTLTIESRPGAGTRLLAEFPVNQAQP